MTQVQPQVITPLIPKPCALVGDVTGNNFVGNFACFAIGLTVGNPQSLESVNTRFLGGPGSPNNPPGNGPMINAQQGDWWFDSLNGNIWFFTGTVWTQKI